MFRHQSVLFFCTLSLPFSAPQTFFHTTHGDGGSFTSVSHGAAAPVHQAQARSYHAPAPSYHSPAPAYSAPAASYHQPAPVPHQTKSFVHGHQASYHQPAPAYHQPAPAYHQPAPAYHQPAPAYRQPQPHAAAPTYGEKCALEYVELSAEVCVPTLDTKCEHEEGGVGLHLLEEEECHDVVRTVCTERRVVVDNEVCAYSYILRPVVTEAKLVEAHWEKNCHEEIVCLNPHHQPSSYSASAYCKEEIHQTCHLMPSLIAAIKKVTVQLPQPVETCINKQVVLPILECKKVKDRHCMLVPKAEEGYKYQIDKCTISLGEPSCQETVLQLPRQACLEKIQKVRTIYTAEETVSYSG